MRAVLQEMFRCLAEGDEVYRPSRFWEMLNEKNVEQLESQGYENFKQTVASNYFTWLIWPRNSQFRYLLTHTRPSDWPSILRGPFSYDHQSRLSYPHQLFLQIYTRMLWRYMQRIDSEDLLGRLEEPTEGNPFKISLDGRLISQDLSNSVSEYYSIREHLSVVPDQKMTICELGAGYGRNAYVFLTLFPNCRYIIIDIPPALFVSQRYLSSVFPDRRVFEFRCFGDSRDVERELESSDIAFLLPHQAMVLPTKSVDLFINISSLHEMNMDQIISYFDLISHVTRGTFYTKQSWISKNRHNNTFLRHTDYPVPSHWRQLFLRPARVQYTFFEAMYDVGS